MQRCRGDVVVETFRWNVWEMGDRRIFKGGTMTNQQ
jgi:hypothetical protein